MRALGLSVLMIGFALAGCGDQASIEPGIDNIMPIILGLPGTDWDVHTSMMGDTARVVIQRPADSEEAHLYLRVTWGTVVEEGQTKSRPVCQVEIRNQDLVAEIVDTVEGIYPGFWQRLLWEAHNQEGRWLAYCNHGQPNRPDHRAALFSLHNTLLGEGLRLNDAIGLNCENLPNGPFDRHELILWFIYPAEIEG